MRNKNKLVLDQLNRKLVPFKALEKVNVPERGWIYTIRKSLNMTLEQLGKRANMTRQGVKKLEEREASGSISLNTLKEIGKALDMKLVYGFRLIMNRSNKWWLIKLKSLHPKLY